MKLLDLILTAIALSMDAFAVSVGKGLCTPRVRLRHCLTCGVYFGGFQALMPLLGYYLGTSFARYITRFDHWIAFVLLALIGANMLREAFSEEEENVDASFGVKTMLVMAVATSIDALATGVTFAMMEGTNIWLAITIVGSTTFLFSAIGVKIGSVFGAKYRFGAEVLGGVILILMGLKILIEHLAGG